MNALSGWENFYLIVGGAAGALIGLQFVVITLVAERPALRVAEAGTAFSTPTIIHFSASLLLSALVRVPWPSITVGVVFLGLLGICGIAYSAFVAHWLR